jgi:prepilin-type N-terminal cleavage/methylation domain-containing protein
MTTNHSSAAAGRAAFTLVELLVVMAIIALLAGLVTPALTRGLQTARQTLCVNNLRQVTIATRFYVTEHGGYPPTWVDGSTRWMDLIKPYLNKNDAVYRCPADPKQIPVTWDPSITMSYGMNSFCFGSTQFSFWYGVQASAVKQPARVILYADCTPGKYYCGSGNRFSEPVPSVDYRHVDGNFVAVFCDGHAEARLNTSQANWDAGQ